MSECVFFTEGYCEIASHLAETPCKVLEGSCDICQKQDPPRARNPVTEGLARHHLKKKGLPFAHLYPKGIITKNKKEISTDVRGKPGSSLKLILHKLGVLGDEGCGCDDYANMMDMWGVNTCEERIEEIIAHLNSQNVSWFDMLRVAKAGFLTTRSLVQTAIDKAR